MKRMIVTRTNQRRGGRTFRDRLRAVQLFAKLTARKEPTDARATA